MNQVIVFFGRNVTQKVTNQKMLHFPTSHNYCLCTTWLPYGHYIITSTWTLHTCILMRLSSVSSAVEHCKNFKILLLLSVNVYLYIFSIVFKQYCLMSAISKTVAVAAAAVVVLMTD